MVFWTQQNEPLFIISGITEPRESKTVQQTFFQVAAYWAKYPVPRVLTEHPRLKGFPLSLVTGSLGQRKQA